MAKKHGTALLDIPQFAEFAGAVVTALPRDIDPDVAQGWIQNKRALREVLHRELTPLVDSATVAPSDWWDLVLRFETHTGRFKDVDLNITGEHFPYAPGDLDDDKIEIVRINQNMDTPEVKAFMDTKGLQPARPMQLIRSLYTQWELFSDRMVVALGQEWLGSVVYVYSRGDHRQLLCHGARWKWDHRKVFFAALPKKRNVTV
ncbi:hypothetical protein HY629_02620 [Candidatus Uhrbacteria bacterium]|nr:hypothetical protein [Candidatus Uhrbacteria bacterium]